MRTGSLNSFLLAAFAALVPLSASAGLSFSNLTTNDFDNVVRELSANFAYSTVEPASSLGGLGNFEFGIVGGTTTANDTYNLVKTAGGGTTTWKTWVPHAGILGRLGLPYSINLEAVIFPKITVSSVKFSNYSGAVMWTPTEMFLEDFPVTIATKFHYSISSIDYSQNLHDNTYNVNVTANPSFRDHMWGLQAIVSRKFAIVEPYLVLGYIKAKGDFSINNPLGGATTLLGSSFGVATSASSHPSTTQFNIGTDVALGFFCLGAEYQRAFGTNSWNGRMSFRF